MYGLSTVTTHCSENPGPMNVMQPGIDDATKNFFNQLQNLLDVYLSAVQWF
jgi:hypothetical protein